MNCGIFGVFPIELSIHIVFLQETKPLYPYPKYLFPFIGDMDMNLGCKELEI